MLSDEQVKKALLHLAVVERLAISEAIRIDREGVHTHVDLGFLDSLEYHVLQIKLAMGVVS